VDFFLEKIAYNRSRVSVRQNRQSSLDNKLYDTAQISFKNKREKNSVALHFLYEVDSS
jgi:hypothetical protein